MINIKLAVIGASGVGKTSLRNQYISGRFSTGYRATIGADFITKTLPHPTLPEQSVMLQIWDTAGQERFSSLSSAFFRGADAAVLMFDVNDPTTLQSLTKWWDEFRERAPLPDEEMSDYCCVVVGNKVDLVSESNQSTAVTEAEALQFLGELVPTSSRPSSPAHSFSFDGFPPDDDESEDDDPLASSQITERPHFEEITSEHADRERSNSIAIIQPHRSTIIPSHSPKHRLAKSRSRSSSRFYSGTMTTTHTTLTIYHTPSSSFFESFHSARSSPVSSPSASPSFGDRRRASTSTSSSSAPTMTPSLFAREQTSTSATTPEDGGTRTRPASLPPPPDRGPKLFFTSAKTGEGVKDVFEYIARRVVVKWEYDERIEARRLHLQEASAGDTIRLGLQKSTVRKEQEAFGGCCRL